MAAISSTIALALKHASELAVDWNGLATELGMTAASSARRKVNTELKQYGLELVGNKVVTLDGSTPAGKTSRKSKSSGTPSKAVNKKRKVEEEPEVEEIEEEETKEDDIDDDDDNNNSDDDKDV